MQSRSMNLILSIFSLLLFASADIATADSTPRCAEDGKVFSIHAGEVVYGSITPTSDPANFFGGERTMKVIVEPPSPSLVFPSGWGYLFSTSAEVESSDMEMQSLTLQALFNGEVACEAGLTYNVLRSPASSSHHSDGKPSASSSEQAQSSSTNGAASLPRCSTQSTRRVYRPTEMYVGTFPLDLVESSCTYQARLLDQPSVGSAAVLLSDPMSYVYTSADEDWGKTTALAYEVACSTAAVCRGEVEIYIYESISTCPTSPMAYEVKLGTELGGSWEVGSTCPADSVASTTVQVLNGPGSLTLLSNEAFIFEATTTESDTIAVIRTSCDGQTLCDLTVAFISTANPHPPQPTTTTTTTEAPAPPIPTCSEEYLYQAPLGKTLRGSLDASLSSCELVTYGSPYMDGRFRGTLAVNILGDFIYTPPREQCVEVAYVNVSCLTTFVCQAKLIFAAYEDLSNDTVPSSSSDVGPTREPVPTCANVYYYQTAPSAPLSSSLNGMPGENACAYGRYFKLRSPPQAGSLEMTMSGDFLYTPRAHEGNYDFGFAMYCLNELACEGSAYLLVSNRWTLTPSEDSTSTKPVVITNPAITCSGTCNTKAWLTYPRPPMWDTTPGRGYGRKDGRPVDAIEVSWANQSLILTAMGMIGNLGARFPTFEPLTSKTGTYFEASDYDTSIAATSPAFNLSCLANQGRVGMGEDVWTWSELGYGTGTGSVGPMYNREVSWYQKFGGKHVQCDVFADPCQYAPLLNPSASAAYGGWTVDVDDCDVTWKGVFPFTHLTDIRRGDGSAVWSFVAHHTLRGTLLSEGVRPHSWISPGRFDTDYRTQEIVVGLKDYAMAFITGPGTPLLSVDAELFTYTTEAGDAAFGINLLCYPKVSLSMTSSYAPDRHVVGFKWTEQVWKAPGPNVCPRCTGKQMTCQASGQPALSTFHGDFPTGNCPDGVGRVELRKGPSMRQGECPAVEAVHEFGEVGISPTRGCKATYQNLTLRGVVPGSGSLSTAQRRAFHWDGHIILQLLMADGSRADVKVEMGLYVASLAASISVGQGELTACRSGSYWPVLDPLGSSTPARPFELSVQAPTSLCVDALSSSFGPNDWAFFTVQLPSVAASRVSLTHIFLDLDDAEQTRIVLFYKDPKTNTAALPPPELGQWWQHTQPYLSFRDLTGEALNRSLIGVSTSIPSGAVAAFLMIPGAINVRTDVEVVVGVEIDAGTTKASRATYRKKLHVAPLLTERSRQGPPQGAANLVVAQRSDLYAIGAAAAVSVALIVAAVMFMVADNKRPLPSWLPRGKVIKHGVLSLVPTALRPKKKSNEAAPLPVHASMYEAMNSGHF